MNFRLKRWLRYILCLVIVLILCWQNANSSEKITNLAKDSIIGIATFLGLSLKTGNLYILVRKIGHGIMFGILSFLGHLAISGEADDAKTKVIWTGIVNIGFAIVAEFFQAYATGRTPTISDSVINIGGATFGILIAEFVEFVRKKRAIH